MDKNKYVYLKNYTPPNFLIKNIVLDFNLDRKKTILKSELSFYVNKINSKKSDLVLDGEKINLKSLSINKQKVNFKRLVFKNNKMIVPKDLLKANCFTLEMENHIDPSSNKSLEGLYLSNNIICTQCEAEGFRKFCYSLDRPDILATYTVRLRGKYNCLLSNGNLIKQNPYFAEWSDPFPKPTYLFALVAGDLVFHEDEFITINKKRVNIKIYHKKKDKGKTFHAMNSIKRAMRWDEIHYNREYDLDCFMIVAIDDFNAGAMENKGLNIFNSRYVLYDDEKSTDSDFKFIEGIIAHEYFHNWTGNRITCRDWFQLCLKEGLTVFREQEYTEQETNGLVERIEQVEFLLKNQFPEDSGSLSHAVRPDKYKEINNFYTATVYEKGAEIIRMLKIISGEKRYKQALELYFSRYDGKACTVEDFQKVFEDCLGMNLSQFFNWYNEKGTPKIRVDESLSKGNYEVTIRQVSRKSTGQWDSKVIPIVYSIINHQGKELVPSTLLILDKPMKRISIKCKKEKPTLSLLKGFSAPVVLEFNQSIRDLKNIVSNDRDYTSVWLAKNKLDYICLQNINSKKDKTAKTIVADFVKILIQNKRDFSLLAKLISTPTELGYFSKLCETEKKIDPQKLILNLKKYRELFSREIIGFAKDYLDRFVLEKKYKSKHSNVSERSLAVALLKHATVLDEECLEAKKMFKLTDSMTLKIACLSLLISCDKGNDQLYYFYSKFKNDRVLKDKWFAIQAQFCPSNKVEETIPALCNHKDFKILNPNSFSSIITTFAKMNYSGFNLKNGKGYQIVAEWIRKIDSFNPQVAARASKAFEHIQYLHKEYSNMALNSLSIIKKNPSLSKDTNEIIQKIIKAY